MSYIGATGYTQYEERFQDIEGNISNVSNDLYGGNYSITSNLNRVIRTSSNIFSNLYIGDDSITSNIIKLFQKEGITYDDLYVGDNSFASNIKYLKNEVQNETQTNPTKTAVYRIKDLENKFDSINTGYQGNAIIDEATGVVIGNGIANAFSSIGANIANIGNIGSMWYFLGACATAAQVAQTNAATANTKAKDADDKAVSANTKADKSLGIWDEIGNNVYHKKSGNVGIGITFADTLNNKLEVNGNINIPLSSNYKIGNEPLNYSHLAGTPPVSSKWTNATDTSTNIFYNTGNVGIGTISDINNKLEVGGNLNISSGSKYKIGDVDLAFSDLGGTLSYNSLTDKLTAGTNITITGNVINNTYSLPTASTSISGGVKVDGTTITINGSGVISGANTYSLPTATTSVLGGVKVDGTTITINNQVISAVAGAQQLNSDWTQTNTSLKSFIQNKPTAGANITFANNQISLTDFVGIGTTPPSGNTKLDVNGNINSTGLRINNLAIGSDPMQNIINLSGNKLLINDKEDTERTAETYTIHTSLTEPSVSPNVIVAIPEINSGSLTHKTLTFTFNKENIQAYYKFNNSTSLGLDSNPSTTKYNLTPTIVGGTGGYNTAINIEGASFQATNDGDYLQGDFPLKSMFDSSTTGISISFWVYKKLATYGNPYNTSIFHLYHPTISTLDISMTLGHYNAIYRTNFSIQYGAGGEIYSSGFAPLLAFDTWYHYVLVITKAGNIKVYFNGANLNLVTGTTDGTIRTYGGSVYPLPTSSFPNTTKLKIFNPTAPAGFSGNIDEFYVFNKELTQDDITSLYNKTYTLPINQYTLSVSEGTSISINSGTFQYLSGNYTISVGATQSSVLSLSGSGQTNPYPLQNGSTIAIRYYMLRRTISVDYYKKSGFIKYVPSLVGGEFPDTGSWAIVDIDNQALAEFGGSISFDRVMGNLPLDKLQDIDMSKITTGNLPISRIDGNLPANKLDNLDMSKITTGQLDYTRLNGQYAIVNDRFLRVIEPYEAPTINTSGIWTSKYRVDTNLHLNHYGAQYNYYRYYVSISSNRNDGWADRHKFWFGVVKFSHKVGTDTIDNTSVYNMYTNATGYCVINPTTSSTGNWWLNITLTTAERTDQAIVILH